MFSFLFVQNTAHRSHRFVSSVMIQSIFTSLSSLSRLILLISYLHMPFPCLGSYLSYLSYLHVLSAILVLISYLLSCTWLVYKPNKYLETNQVCTLRNTAVLSTGSFLRLRLSLSWVGTLPELSSCVVLTASDHWKTMDGSQTSSWNALSTCHSL